MLNKYMRLQLEDPQKELTSLFEGVLRTDFEFQLSAPYSDPDNQFYSLVQCFEILNQSKQKYMKKLELELKKLVYSDDTYKALSLTTNEGQEGGLDVSKKKTRNYIDDCLLTQARRITNLGNLSRSQAKNGSYLRSSELEVLLEDPTKEMISRASLIPNRKRNETKKNFQARVKKGLSSRYNKRALFGILGSRFFSYIPPTSLMYFQEKFIPLAYPISQFPLHARSRRKGPLDLFTKSTLGSMFSILAEKTLEVHFKLSQEYFEENNSIYQKIDSLLQTYQHNEININHSTSLVQLLLRGFDSPMHRDSISHVISPWERKKYASSRLTQLYVETFREMQWVSLDAPLHDLKLQPQIFWRIVRTDLENFSNEYGPNDPLSEFIFRSFNSFSDGFGRSSQHNKVKAEDKLAISIMERIKSHLEELKKPFLVQDWLGGELSNYHAKSFTQDDQEKNDIDYYETLPKKSLRDLFVGLVVGFLRDEDKIKQNLKKFRKVKKLHGEKYGWRKEWVQKHIPDHLLAYLDGFYEGDKFKDLIEMSYKIGRLEKAKDPKKDLTPEEYFDLRKYLARTRRLYRNLQDEYLSDDKKKRQLEKLGRSVIPRLDMVPEELFTLRKSYGKSFDQETVALITEVLQIIEQNPIVGMKLRELIIKEVGTYPPFLAMKKYPYDIARENEYKANETFKAKTGYTGESATKKMFLNQILDYVESKIESMINTHIYSLADSLSRILLIAKGVCPYKDNQDNNTYQKIIDEIKSLVAFFELYLEGLIKSALPSDRPVEQKLLVWEIRNNLKAIEKYFLTLEYAQIDVENKPEIPAFNPDFSLEQIFLIGKKREGRRVLNEQSIAACLDGKLFTKKYQKHSYIQKFLKKEKSALKWSQKNFNDTSLLERESAINWLKARSGYRNLSYGDWKEDVGYYHFSLTYLNTK